MIPACFLVVSVKFMWLQQHSEEAVKGCSTDIAVIKALIEPREFRRLS
jgi:hypothetical protein